MSQRPAPTFFVPMLQDDPRAIRGSGSPRLLWMPRTEALPRGTQSAASTQCVPSPAERNVR
ncbi:MAG: hypothetical protein ACI9MC_000675 [Kiritimatiellia bacterium]|jgi:hypothetical protein